jgi:3-hydroxyisobutyrate dehydrogenase
VTDQPDGIRVGFIGIGVMGASMAGHLLDAGCELGVYTRTRDTASDLEGRGAVWHANAGSLAGVSDVVFTMVGYPSDVESLYRGEDGLLAAAAPGAVLVDCTTSSPTLAATLAAEGAARGVAVLDAPVTGGDVGARAGTLSVMVGGEARAFERIRPLLDTFSSRVVLQGEAGAGQHAKMANQIAIASTMLGMCESLAYAQAAGLDLDRVLESVSGGSAGSWSLSNLAPRALAGDLARGFYVKHFVKDLRIALESAASLGVGLPGLELAMRLYERLAADGHADDGTQALWLLYDRAPGAEREAS